MSSFYLEAPWRKAVSEAFNRGFAAGQLKPLTEDREEDCRLIHELYRRIEELVSTLRFYADEDNYDDDGTADWPDRSVPVQNDEGERARIVLARYANDDEGERE